MTADVARPCRCLRVRHRHGTVRAYQSDKCRCFPCRIAYSQYRGSFGATRVGSDDMWTSRVGTRRRLQALHVIGWTDRLIGERLGVSGFAVHQLRCSPSPRILRSTAGRVARVYTELWDQPPPATEGTKRTRTVATRAGWAPPLAWDDIDNPDEKPKHRLANTAALHRDVILPRLERVAALTAQGLSAQEIAVRLGTTPRLVTRDRARIRQLQQESAA